MFARLNLEMRGLARRGPRPAAPRGRGGRPPRPALTLARAAEAAEAAGSGNRGGTACSVLEGLALERERVDLRGQEDDHVVHLVRPASVDAVLDRYVAAGLLDGDPYWARLWPSAVAIAEELLQRPALVRGKTVWDVGCGLGLAGLAAALAGAAEVALLDKEEAAVALCSRAIAANRELQGAEFADALRAVVFDWNAPGAGAACEVLLLCDVLYEGCNVEPVAALMGRVLKHGGVVVLADPPERNRANRLELLRRLEEGSDLVLEEQHTRAVRLEDKGHDVVLLLLRKMFSAGTVRVKPVA